MRRTLLGALLLSVGIGLLPGAANASNPGDWSQDQVNAAITNGVGWIATQQNANGSFGSVVPTAETGLALISFGVADGGHYANLSPAQQAEVKKGVDWLLSRQSANGDWSDNGEDTYNTGLALTALSFSGDVPETDPSTIPTAIAKGRAFLIGEQNAPPSVTGNPATPSCTSGLGPNAVGQSYCGGWNYTPNFGRSDESNTGFALTGLDTTGGVPAATAQVNVGWQRHAQELHVPTGSTVGPNDNPEAIHNDGAGWYGDPNWMNYAPFVSNGNNTGSLIFGYGYDGVPASDAGVTAALKIGNDFLDEYQLNKSVRGMLSHTGNNEDGTCVIGSGCDWIVSGDGGYHYSLFALSKGLGNYAPAQLSDPTNYYAKIVDLLLSQQNSTNGSWPADLRDDASQLGATAFAVMALGRVGQPATVAGSVYQDSNGNGHQDAGEAGLSGRTVYIDVKGSGKFDAADPSATTDAKGNYLIQNVPSGNYDVRVVPNANYTCTQPSASCIYSGVKFASDEQLTGYSFGQLPNSVSGTVFNDVNANGTRDVGDGGLAGWTVFVDLKGSGTLDSGDPRAVSASDGTYQIQGIPAGKYDVRVIAQSGYSCTRPSPCVYAQVSTAGRVTGRDFGENKPAPQQQVKAVAVASGLSALGPVPRCVAGRSFEATVSGRSISDVVVWVDGHRIRSLSSPNRSGSYVTRIYARARGGAHRLRVQVSYLTGSGTAPRTYSSRFAHCAVALPVPKFTG